MTSFIIDKDARFDCGSDHALLECDMEFSVRLNVKWTYQDVFQYNNQDGTDFTEYHAYLDTLASTIRLDVWRYSEAVASANLVEKEMLQGELDITRERVKESIVGVKLDKRHRLRNKLLKGDPTRKKFWRFLKSQMKSAGNITGLKNF